MKNILFYISIRLLTLWMVMGWAVVYADAEVEHLSLGVDQPYTLFIDESSALTIDDVSRLPNNSFKSVHGGLSLSYTHSAAWLRFELPAGRHDWWLEIQPAVLDLIQLYQLGPEGWNMYQAGDIFPYRDRQLVHRYFVFRLMADQSANMIYLRVKSTSSLFMVANLWSPEAFATHSAGDALIWGIYFGMLIIALLFMMAMVAINRNRPYLILTVALVINGLHAANSQGFFTSTLWSAHPAWGNISIGVTGPWALAATIWTIREFLVRRFGLIRLDYLYIGAAWFCALCPLSQIYELYGETMRVALGLNLLAVIGGLLILALRCKQFEKFEWVMTFMLIFYLSGFMATYLPVLGYIPSTSQLLFYRNSLLIFIPLFASAALLLEVRQTYWNLLQEKSRALELSIQSELSSETLLRTLYDTTSEAVMLVNEQGFIGCNKATLKMFGCATEEAFCKFHPADLSPPEQAGGLASRVLADQRIAKALEEGSIRFEWLHKRADNGALFHAYVILNAMELNGKRVLQALTQDITERKKLEETIHNLAYYDELTELPNRRMLNDRLTQALAGSQRSGAYGALMFLDLDNFKPLNDKYGHAVGDLLLIEAARRLNGCVRGIDTVARLGGDEFVVMLNGLHQDLDVSKTQAMKIAEKIHNILAAPYYLAVDKYTQPENIVEYHCTASIGGVLFKGHELSQEEILNRGDLAMYQAKAEGRNLIRFAL